MFDIPLYYISLYGGNFEIHPSSLSSLGDWIWYITHLNLSTVSVHAVDFAHSAMFLWIMTGTLFLAERVVFAVTIYKDARQRNPKFASVWTILTALFGLVPIIAYAVVNRVTVSQRVVCVECGHATHPIREERRVKLSRLWVILSIVFFAAFSFSYNYAFCFSSNMS